MQVALLFLTRGAMPLEAVWREFFEAAALVEAVDPHVLLAPEVTHEALLRVPDQGYETRHVLFVICVI